MAPADVTVAELIKSAIASIAEQAESRNIEIETAIADSTIHADRDRITQVIVNLLSNAIKFSQAGSSVKITAVSNNSRLELRVSDQGRGIPKSKQESIFERFVQIEKEDAGFRGGSGLGLSIARSIVEQHGGKIGVDSTEGSGSTFWFWVPLAGTASSRSNQPESQA